MQCQTCYTLAEALKQAHKNIEDFRDIAEQYESLYDNSQKDCEAMTQMFDTLIEAVDAHLKSKRIW